MATNNSLDPETQKQAKEIGADIAQQNASAKIDPSALRQKLNDLRVFLQKSTQANSDELPSHGLSQGVKGTIEIT